MHVMNFTRYPFRCVEFLPNIEYSLIFIKLTSMAMSINNDNNANIHSNIASINPFVHI